ncbi:GNAT family N-acetyltransferase [Gemella parahaemolysans]|mgnify:CR=1 FL=1
MKVFSIDNIFEGVDMNISFEKGINGRNSLLICEWSNEKGEEFQKQWMGSKISYPLDLEKIRKLENIFSIFHEEEFIGVIQIIKIEGNNAHLGRFMLNPLKVGQGFGKNALELFVYRIFEDENIDSITLTVFDSNITAKKLYEKLGFRIDKVIEFPNLKYIMKKTR